MKIKIKLPTPFPVQQKILNQASRFNAVTMGEQGGKTTLGIEIAIASPFGALAAKGDVVWVSPEEKDLVDVRRRIKMAINGLIKLSPNPSKITLHTGNSIHLVAANNLPKSFPEASLVIVDDAKDINSLGDLMENVLLESIRQTQGSAWFLSSACSKAHEFYGVFERGSVDPEWSCWQFPSKVNPFLPEETKLEMERATVHEVQCRFMAEFVDADVVLTETQRIIGYDESFRQWCERLASEGLKVDGRPFSLDNRAALIPIYDAIPTHKEDAKDKVLVIQKATQLGLTIWEVLANIYMSIKWGPVSIGMFMPAQTTAIHKSEHRFMRIVRSSPQLYDILTTGSDMDGKDKKVGEGNVLTRRVKNSLLLFLWTTGKVTTESVPLDVVSLDETQEMQLDHIDKVRARTGDSDIAFTLMLSTANMDDQDINFWYRKGTQEVWHTECQSCGAFSDLSDPGGVFPDKSIGYNGGDVEGIEENEYYWRCPECGSPIDDPQVGKYIATSPGKNTIRSFLLPRTISPKITPRKMMEGWFNAKTGNQKKSFYNRTLARPYIDVDQLPVSMSHCLAAMEEGMARGLQWKKRARDTYMGLDQMGSFNVCIIKERLADGRQAVIHVEAIFDDNPFERCSALMDIYGVAVCVVEQLPNVNDARRFANRHQGRVFLAGYADLRDDQMVWGDQLSRSDSRTSEEDRSRYTVTLNQYKCMQTALFRVKEKICLFPDADELEQDVIDNGVRKRIHILRDWVFLHFTKIALVVDDGSETESGRVKKSTEARKLRTKVLKVGIDPHFSYANMLCDVAWARSHGTSTFILPDVGNNHPDAIKPEAIGVPTPLAAVMEEIQSVQYHGDVCGRCINYDSDTKQCREIGMVVQPKDPGCMGFIGSD